MEKEFIPYELAVKLKTLGFDEPCFGYYDVDEGYSIGYAFCYSDRKLQPEIGCSAPIFSQAFRWFREKHNLVFNFINYSIVKPGEYHWSITWNDEAKAVDIVKTYEEAELACLTKLIEIVEKELIN